MIDPKQIPDEVVEALGAALGNTRPTWDYAEAIAAALSAWPGAALAQRTYPTTGTKRISLPIPQECNT